MKVLILKFPCNKIFSKQSSFNDLSICCDEFISGGVNNSSAKVAGLNFLS